MNDLIDVLTQIGNELSDCLSNIPIEACDKAVSELVAAPRIFVAGAGRSGLAMRAFAMRLMHAGKTVHVVGDTTTPSIRSTDILVIGSGSGATSSLVLAANKARKIGASVILVTTAPDSILAQVADTVVAIGAPTPKASDTGAGASIQPMANLFEQSLFILLDALVVLMMPALGETSETMFTRHANLE